MWRDCFPLSHRLEILYIPFIKIIFDQRSFSAKFKRMKKCYEILFRDIQLLSLKQIFLMIFSENEIILLPLEIITFFLKLVHYSFAAGVVMAV